MNGLAMRLWGAGFAMLSPGDLIDRLLDRLDRFREAMMPVQSAAPICATVPIKTSRDRPTT